MSLAKGSLNRLMVLFLAFVLLVPTLVACDSDDAEDAGPADISAKAPVKIGLLGDWSGPIPSGLFFEDAAVLVEDQVRRMGGILDGRPVEIIMGDGHGILDDAIAAFEKMAAQDGVCAIVGGAGGVEGMVGNTYTAEQYRTPYFSVASNPDDLTDYPYTSRVISLSEQRNAQDGADFILNEFKAEKVALLGTEDVYKPHESTDGLLFYLRQKLESAGVQIVFDETSETGVADYAPYLERIKAANPDVLVAYFGSVLAYMDIFNSIQQAGGLGDIRFLSPSDGSMLMIHSPGAEGTFHIWTWVPGSSWPGTRVFEDAFERMYGRSPNIGNQMAYLSLWTAIHAIELAGSDDPQEIARAARSGLLTWDSPIGRYTLGTDGQHNLKGQPVVIRDGEIIPYKSGR